FPILEYPSDEVVRFVFISRIMKKKGIDQYLEAAEQIKRKYTNTEFHICGFCEEDYEGILKDYEDKGIIIYHGMVRNVVDILKVTHCTIHPTYYPEGMSNVLLESAACGTHLLTTDRSCCREIVDASVNGYIINLKDSQYIIENIEKFLETTTEEKIQLGLAGRKKIEEKFDRNIVVEAYSKRIKET